MNDRFRKPRHGELTEARVLGAVIGGAADSRKAIESGLAISKASACRMVDRLLEKGILLEGATVPTLGRGRNAAVLHAAPDFGYVVGADLEGLALRVRVLDSGRNVLASRNRAIHPDWSVQRILGTWRSLITEAITSADIDSDRLIALGVALPGMASAGEGVVRTYLPPGRLVEFDVREELAGFGLPIVASDNTLCVAEFERRLGSARGDDSFLSVLVRYGIGATIFSRGRFVIGEEIAASDLGHMRIDLNGPLCVCGRSGCLDAFCSGRTWPGTAALGTKAWENSLIDRARLLGLGVANLLKLAGSPKVVLNGIYNEYESLIREPLEEAIRADLSPIGLTPPALDFGLPLDEKACVGAALRAVDREIVGFFERQVKGEENA